MDIYLSLYTRGLMFFVAVYKVICPLRTCSVLCLFRWF